MPGFDLEIGAQSEGPNDQAEDPKINQGAPDQEPQGTGFIITESIARKVLAMPYAFVASRRGKHWELTSVELDMLSPPVARELQRLIGKWSEKYPDAALIALGLAMVTGSRMAVDASKARKAAKEEGEKQSGQAGSDI